jgi:hypothetical protein
VCRIIRTALKLHLTTSILSLVLTITRLSSALSTYLSPQFFCHHGFVFAPFNAPKLITRQIKSSIYYLQKQFLQPLFSDLFYQNKLVVEVRLFVALIVSVVLDTMRATARGFAKWAENTSSMIPVKEQELKDYERNMGKYVFDTIRASICDFAGGGIRNMGELGDRLRSLGHYDFLI